MEREFWLGEKREGRGRRMKSGKGRRITVFAPKYLDKLVAKYHKDVLILGV